MKYRLDPDLVWIILDQRLEGSPNQAHRSFLALLRAAALPPSPPIYLNSSTIAPSNSPLIRVMRVSHANVRQHDHQIDPAGLA